MKIINIAEIDMNTKEKQRIGKEYINQLQDCYSCVTIKHIK